MLNAKSFQFLVLFFLLFQSFSYAQTVDLRSQGDSITLLTLRCEFDKALKKSDSLMQITSDPLPGVLKLVTLGMRDIDVDMTVDSVEFIKTYETTEKRILDYQKKCGNCSQALYFDGLAKAIRATFFLRIESYRSALQTGLNSISLLKDAQKTDPSNSDADFFLGLYDYSKGELRRKLWWVLFWYPGDKQQGIKRLESCAQSGRISKKASQFSLIDVYIRENNLPRAWYYIDNLKKADADGRFLWWAEAKYYEAAKKYSQAAEKFDNLSKSYENVKFGEYNHIFTMYKTAEMKYKAGDYNSAKNLGNSILQKCTFKRATSIKRDTRKLLEKINESKCDNKQM